MSLQMIFLTFIIIMLSSCNKQKVSTHNWNEFCLSNFTTGDESKEMLSFFNQEHLSLKEIKDGKLLTEHIFFSNEDESRVIRIWESEDQVIDFSCYPEHLNSFYNSKDSKVTKDNSIAFIERELENRNSCLVNEDCSALRMFPPFKCWYPINNGMKLKLFNQLSTDIQNSTNYNDRYSATCLEVSEIKCVNQKCDIGSVTLEMH